MKRNLIIAAFLGLMITWIAPVNAQNRIEFKEFKLENGLTVVMHKDPATPIVAVNVTYHVGSKNERPDRTGFAHFFEHLLFEGTANIGRGEYMKKVESIGGTLNAGTSKDYTTYYEIVPSNQLETVLYMESERMLHAKIDEIGITTQRGVIKEEKSQTQDNRPYGTLVKEVFERTHPNHPYRWTIIGETEHLDAATHAEFMEFYNTYYVPNNAVLAIAGDIDYAQTEALVRKYFGEIPKGSRNIPRTPKANEVRTAEVRDIIYDNIQLPAVIQSYNLPPMQHKDMPAFELLSTYLTGGASSLLTKELVDNQQKALAMMAIPFALEDGGLFILYGIANMGVEAGDLEKSMDEQLALVRANGLTDADFEKLKAQVESNTVNSFGSVANIASELAANKIFYGDANEINRKLEKYSNVTKEDLQRVAKEYLTNESRVVLYYLPKNQQQ
jgi:zinc protease